VLERGGCFAGLSGECEHLGEVGVGVALCVYTFPNAVESSTTGLPMFFDTRTFIPNTLLGPNWPAPTHMNLGSRLLHQPSSDPTSPSS
jgi:hypothetical protein